MSNTTVKGRVDQDAEEGPERERERKRSARVREGEQLLSSDRRRRPSLDHLPKPLFHRPSTARVRQDAVGQVAVESRSSHSRVAQPLA